MLDALLAAVTDAGELPEVFDRISTASQNVLAHDALVLTAVLPNGTEARAYAKKTAKGHELPDVVKVPPLMRRDPGWDHDIVDDLRAQPDHADLAATKAGYRSVLRVAIRLDGEYAAGLSFLSLQPAQYHEADVPAARRIADRIALSFARERTKALAKQADEATIRAETARVARASPPRTRAPFIAMNCAALPDQLLESELFGYERGAFTSAAQSKPGQLEQAASGTLFLDEVGEMSTQVQPKFLREFNKSQAAKALGVTRAQLYVKLRQYGLD